MELAKGWMRFACAPADFCQAWFVRIVKEREGLNRREEFEFCEKMAVFLMLTKPVGDVF